MGRADRLCRALGERVLRLVGPVEDAMGEVYVGWFAALDAAACPARFRASGDEGWGFPGWNAQNSGPAIARAALHRHLDSDRPYGAPPLPEPLALVREWMTSNRPVALTAVGCWVAERLDAGDAPTLAAAAASATRWLTGFVRALGWPLPPGLALLGGAAGSRSAPDQAATARPLVWRPAKGAPVKVASGADARLGRQRGSGDFAMVVHRPIVGADDRLADRAAFEATAAALAIRIVPARVLVTAGDTGDVARLDVDDALLARGADLIAGVVEQRALATGSGWSAEDATPTPACRHCHLAPTCPPGTAWLDGPGRWRGGLPRLLVPHDLPGPAGPPARRSGEPAQPAQSPVGNGSDGPVVR